MSDSAFADYYTEALLRALGVASDDPDIAKKTEAANGALVFALQLIESYLDRQLDYVADAVETFGPPPTQRALLRRYPVEVVSEVSYPPLGPWEGTTVPPAGYVADLPRGIVFVNGYGFGWFGYGWPAAILQVTFSGGYKPEAFPRDLLAVIMALAESLYPEILAGAIPTPSASPQIKRISVPDVGTVELLSEGDGGAAADVMGFGSIPASMIGVLDRYRAESIVGGA